MALSKYWVALGNIFSLEGVRGTWHANRVAAQDRFFHAGELIFTEGDASHCMYLVVEGTISIHKAKDGVDVQIAKINSNEVIGELAFFDRSPRSATAIALTDVKVMEITFDSLDKIYVNVPEYLKSIFSATANRLRRATDAIRRLESRGVRRSAAIGVETSDVSELAEATDLDEALASTADKK